MKHFVCIILALFLLCSCSNPHEISEVQATVETTIPQEPADPHALRLTQESNVRKETYLGKAAYMTVEAFLVMPIILGGIVFVMYVGFYLYNAATIKQTAYIAALRGNQMKNVSSYEIENYVEKQVDEILSQQILSGKIMKKEVKVSKGSINVKIYTELKMPFTGLADVEDILREIIREVKVKRTNPMEVIRGVRKVNGYQISK